MGTENPTTGEIEENAGNVSDESSRLLTDTNTNQNTTRSVRTKVPEVEIHLLRCGEGPIDVFKSSLGGWDQDQLEVKQILDKYGLKMVYGYNAVTGRGVPIRFNPRNGRSILPYRDGAVIYIDGEPKDSIINPITRIVIWVAFLTLLLVLVMNDTPQWAKNMNLSFQTIPPWALTCAVIVFARMRKRTRTFLKTLGW
ncbi:hypothetical protein LguiA_018409 [Lonicera macranthoides]